MRNEGTFTLSGGAVCANSADKSGADVSTCQATSMTLLPAKEMDQNYFSATAWYYDEEDARYVEADTPIEYDLAGQTDTEDRNLIAGYETIVVSYDANGGEGELPEDSVFEINIKEGTSTGSVTIASGEGLNKYGMNLFTGWNTKSDGSGTAYEPGETITIDHNLPLYAQYEPHEHVYSEDGFCPCDYYEPAAWDDTADAYQIGNLGQFYWFVSLVNGEDAPAEYTSEDTDRGASANAVLTADIGTTDTPVEKNITTTYRGDFDGQGYTITLNLNGGKNQNTALFAITNGASICNLYTAGIIEAGDKYASGIVSEVDGNFTMKCCISSVDINSSVNGDGTHGGLVANLTSSSRYTISDCAFTGSLIGENTTYCGVIVGWKNGNASGTVFCGYTACEETAIRYSNEAHGITVTVALNSDVPEGYKITYSEEEDGNYTETNPIFTDVGEHTVYYVVSKDNYEDVTGFSVVTIHQAAQDISYAVTALTKLETSHAFTNELTKGLVFEEESGNGQRCKIKVTVK